MSAGDDLHHIDAGTGRTARRGLDGQTRHARHLQGAGQVVVLPEHGVAAVDVAAPEKQRLLAAVNDAPIGKIGALFFDHHRAVGISVEVERNPGTFGHLQQLRQQPDIPAAGQQQIGVVAGQDGLEADE